MRKALKALTWIVRRLATFIRMAVVGGAVAFYLIGVIDGYTKPEYGTKNLVIIAAAFSFFPLFFALFVEFFIWGWRKKRKETAKDKDLAEF